MRLYRYRLILSIMTFLSLTYGSTLFASDHDRLIEIQQTVMQSGLTQADLGSIQKIFKQKYSVLNTQLRQVSQVLQDLERLQVLQVTQAEVTNMPSDWLAQLAFKLAFLEDLQKERQFDTNRLIAKYV